jgi:hypothetical protein
LTDSELDAQDRGDADGVVMLSERLQLLHQGRMDKSTLKKAVDWISDNNDFALPKFQVSVARLEDT